MIIPILFVLLGTACRENAGSGQPPRVTNNNQVPVNANSSASSGSQGEITTQTYEIVKTYKHDSKAFTQGLVFHNGALYESTGQYGDSTLRRVRIEDGDVEKELELDKQYFAEGLTLLNDKLYQLTWEEQTCFVYDLATFEPAGKMFYNGEGWGLTTDGTNLIMSDGSHQLQFIDPKDFRVQRTVNVFHNNRPLVNLNELEFVKGEIYANVWHSERPDVLGKPNHIARIDPATGKLLGWIDLSGISPEDAPRGDGENTLNGIAYDAAADRLFVTGKRWKKLFEIKLKPKA